MRASGPSKNPVRRAVARLTPMRAALAGIGFASWLAGAPAPAQTRIPSTALPSGPATQPLVGGSTTIRQPQVISGGFAPYQVNGNTATVTQTDAAGILRWGSFDIGSAAKVQINQPNASAILLNRVDGGAFQNRTVIEGMLAGNGQVFIYNPNGVVIGRTASIDLHSFTATTLGIDNTRFLSGILAPSTAAVLAAESGARPGDISVEGDATGQARITAAAGGRILLAAPSVTNNGALSAPDGQVILAAGGRVFLASSSDLRLRGLLVEVNNANLTAGAGAATNDSFGRISVGTGNATLVGQAVNQNGRISANTTVESNGSIFLRARDGASKATQASDPVATSGGTLTLGAGSVTEILPSLGETSTITAASFRPSWVDMSGRAIRLRSGSQVLAPGATVDIAARANPSLANPGGSDARVTIESGATIDVAGTTTATLAMESNVIEVQLRGSELADYPLNRDGAIRGQTAFVDVRANNGTGTPIANVSGYLNLVGKTVGELTATGGSVNLRADDGIVFAEGARIDVSGGRINYLAGHVATSQLTSNGQSFDIGRAPTDRVFDGVVNTGPSAGNYEAGYSDGRSAGSVSFDAPAVVLRGQLAGGVTPGPKQRDVGAASYPKGGELVIGNAATRGALGELNNFNFLGNLVLGGHSTAGFATPAWNEALSGALRATLDLRAPSGFTRLRAYTRGDIEVDTAIDLGAGGELSLAAGGDIALRGSVSAPGGTLNAAAIGAVSVAAGTRFDLAGRWTNDRAVAAPRDAAGRLTEAIVTGGGSIGIAATEVTIGDGVRFDVSGGATQSSAGRITGGRGGSISIDAVPESATVPLSARLSLGRGVEFRGYGLATGGSLRLTGRNVVIGDVEGAAIGAGQTADLALQTSFFRTGGFLNYAVRATANLKVASGTTIAPTMDVWWADRLTATQASGSMGSAFALMSQVPGYAALPVAGAWGSRAAANLSLAAQSELTDGLGRLWLAASTAIVTEPGATVTLSAGRQITLEGTVSAPAGAINVYLTPDTGEAYRPERSVWLGAGAILSAAGSAARMWTDGLGVSQGELLGGGSVRIGRLNANGVFSALPGYVIAQAGSRIDVSGAAADLVTRYGRWGTLSATVASAGGSVDIRAREGLLIAGAIKGAGGNASAPGGSLSLVLDRESAPGGAGYPTDARTLIVGAGAPNLAGLAADAPVTGFDATGRVNAALLASTGSALAGGFDNVRLKSQDVIAFDVSGGGLGIATRNSLTIDAPSITVTGGAAGRGVTLGAPYVQFGNSDWRYQSSGATASGGAASLAVIADTIDITGNSALGGVGTASFRASGDIRLTGRVATDLGVTPVTATALHSLGALSAGGALDFSGAQVYPTTLSAFTIGTTGDVHFAGGASGAAAPLAAAGSLTVNAANIAQGGVLRAPFGSIALNATGTLTLAPGSVTSVAGEGLVPLGRVSNGRDWVYDFGNGNLVTFSDPGAANYHALPDKSISTSGASVVLARGARVDASGGGTLYGYEFTPGPGGSTDVLAKPAAAAAPTTFAVLPGYGAAVAPADYQYAQDGGLNPGDRVYLSGVPGLPAGLYTLLPARYALMPGAFAVTPLTNRRDMTAAANAQQLDGSWIVAGYRATAAGQDGRSSGFQVRTAAQVRQLAQYDDYSGAAGVGAAMATLPGDAGRVAFAATGTLALDGIAGVRLAAAPAGRGGQVDIAAPQIVVVGNAAQGVAASALKLVASDLVALKADSLLIGGVRERRADGTHVAVGAGSVTLDNPGAATDAAQVLSGREVILAARDTVRVTGGSVVRADTAPERPATAYIIDGVPAGGGLAPGASATGAQADGALLRVSGGAQAAIARNAPAGVTGTLDIGAGAIVGAIGSFNLDATKSLTTTGFALEVTPATAFSLGAARISLGDAIPQGTAGVSFDATGLAALSRIGELSLTSYSTIDTYGSVTLGNTATRSLTLVAGGLQAFDGAGGADRQVNLVADRVRLEGGGAFTPATTTGADGSVLGVRAREFSLGSGSFAVHGVKDVNIVALAEVRADGRAGRLAAERNLTITAGRITAGGGKDGSFTAGTQLRLEQAAAAVTPTTAPAYGGKLAFSADSIVSNADIVAHGGRIAMQAQSGLALTGGSLSAGGGPGVAFGSTTVHAPGGAIVLDAGAGNLSMGAALDVATRGTDAGSVALRAGSGTLAITGSLAGGTTASGTASPQAGSFSVDARTLANDFGTLNTTLNDAGFTAAREFRIRQGDVTLGAGQTIRAQRVAIAADNGNLNIGGTIDASGAKGGSIELFAGQASAAGSAGNVRLANTARLNANATSAATSAAGSTGHGGSVTIGTATADGSAPAGTAGGSTIVIAASGTSTATIDVSGSGVVDGIDTGGRVLLRTPRIGAGTGAGSAAGGDIAVAGIANLAVTGSAESVVEGYKVYTATTIGASAGSATNLDARASGAMLTEANTFAGAAAPAGNGAAALGAGFALRAGIEVRSTGNLTVSVNETAAAANGRGWDLSTWRPGGQPIGLTLRAAGNLAINGSISDGFTRSATTTVAMPGWQLDTSGAASASYRLVGGADVGAANVLAVASGGAGGDVSIGFARTSNSGSDQAVALVRTGSGRIDVAAARDIVLATLNPGTDTALGAAIYTAGRFAPLVGNGTDTFFNAPQTQVLNPQFAPNANTATTARFAAGGGGIALAAGRNVVGPVTAQLTNNWLFRRGRTTINAAGETIFASTSFAQNPAANTWLQTAWWSRYDYFNQGIATFAGGDIRVTAGGNIGDLGVSAATSGQVTSDAARRPLALTERGGGDISVSAGGDIAGGSIYVQKGEATVRAGGSFTYGSRLVDDQTRSPQAGDTPGPIGTLVPLRPVLAVGDGSISVAAGRDLQVESVINPTLTRQSTANAAALTGATPPALYGYFGTYASGSGVRLTSLAGDILLSNNAQALKSAGGASLRAGLDSSVAGEANYINMYQLYPGSLTAAALGGSIVVQHGMSLFPSPTGQLELLAAGSVRADFLKDATGTLYGVVQPIVMLDANPAAIPAALAPRLLNSADFALLNGSAVEGLPQHTSGGLHAADRTPARVVAVSGDITGEHYFGGGGPDTLILPKHAEILAGRDIRDFGFRIQNLDASDVTQVRAGRDFIDSTNPGLPSFVRHTVTGPGLFDLAAGRTVDLGNAAGVTTRGNLDNPYLPEGGAALVVSAGAQADYAHFYAVQSASTAGIPFYVRSAVAAAQAADPALKTLFDGLAAGDATVRAALNASASFRTLKTVLNRWYFDLLKTAGGADGSFNINLPAFDGTIASLFPTARAGGGDINVFGSQFKTEQGGSIDLFAPGGSVYAGLLNVPSYLSGKSPSTLGIFTVRGGDLRAQVRDDFLVNQGRVFTLYGGDIILASQFGDIDAGRGSKTATSAPPPVLRTDANGNTVVDISGSVSGSGIGALQTAANAPQGDLVLITPRGSVDAGDAGLRAKALTVICQPYPECLKNRDNIAVNGPTIAPPTPASGGTVAPPPPAPPAATPKGDQLVASAKPEAAAPENQITVQVLGVGPAGTPAQPAGPGAGTAAPAAAGATADPAPRREGEPRQGER